MSGAEQEASPTSVPVAPRDTISVDRPSEQPTAIARAYAEIVGKLDEQTRRDLAAMLEHRLAAPRGNLVREATLGLWSRIFEASGGVIPLPREYDAAHAEIKAKAEKWPDRRTLERYYGGFLEVNAAGLRAATEGGEGRVPANFSHGTDRPPKGFYSRPGVIDDAIEDFYDRWGFWPHPSEYYDWAKLEHRAARQWGRQVPALPGRKPIRRAYSSFEAAVGHARRRRELRGGPRP